MVPRRFWPDAAEVEANLVAAAADGSAAQLCNSWRLQPASLPPSITAFPNWTNGSTSARLPAHRSARAGGGVSAGHVGLLSPSLNADNIVQRPRCKNIEMFTVARWVT